MTWGSLICGVAIGLWAIGGVFRSHAHAASASGEKADFDPQRVPWFGGGKVFSVELHIEPSSMASLRSDPRAYQPARIRVGGVEFAHAAVHLKGKGSYRSIDGKPSITVDLGRFHGSGSTDSGMKLHLNNSIEDESLMNELIGSELLTAAGVPAPRVGHARVRLNGKDLGLYVLKEGFDGAFATRHFGPSGARMFEPAQGEDVDGRLDEKGVRGGAHLAIADPLRELGEAISEPDLTRRWKRLGAVCDLEQFATLVAIEVLTGHWDGYAMAGNNYRVCVPASTGKVVVLAAGMDQLFANPGLEWRPRMRGRLATAVLETPEGARLYGDRMRFVFDRLFDTNRIATRIESVGSVLMASVPAHERGALREGLAEVERRVIERGTALGRRLSAPEKAMIPVMGRASVSEQWGPADVSSAGVARRPVDDRGGEYLELEASAASSTSWRRSVRLARGRYRFEGRARVFDVVPLAFGSHQGARLRVRSFNGDTASLCGTTEWCPLGAEFEVKAFESDVELTCELRARSGRVWFDPPSLALVRLD